MSDRNVRVLLSLVVSGFDAGARQAKASAESLAQSIEKTGEATAQAEKDAAKAGADAAKRAAEARSALESLSTVALTVGAAILAGVGVATKAYADFDKQMSAVKSTGQDAVANFDALRDAAIEAGASTAFSASEAAAGMEAMMKAGMSAENVIAGGLKNALDLAASGNMSVADSADFMATAMKNFSIEGADSVRVADAIAAAANKAQGDVSDMANAFKYVSIPARDAGMSLEMTAGAVAQLAEAGIIGEQAGTSLRSVLMSLTAPSQIAQKAMDELGITLYDGQGKFLGYENAVQQLQDKLGPLSDAQRDMALGTIFGNESISAARVLMEGGADAAREWAEAVSEQGYASDLAATKLDNLAGDLEALGGAFESAFIKSGSGVNDFLRGFVQGATALVNVIGSIPGPVLATGTALAGLAGAGLVVAGGLGHAVGTFIDLRSNISTLRGEFPKLDAAMGKVGWKKALVGAAALTAGLIALTVAAEANRDTFARNIKSADDLGAMLLRTADKGKALNDAFTLDTQGLFSGVTREVDGLGDALARILQPSAMQGFEDMMNGFFTGGSAAQQMRTQFQQLDQTLAGMVQGGNAEAAARIFDQVVAAAQAQGIEIAELAPLFESYSGALRTSAGASGETLLATELLAGGMDATADSAKSATDRLIALGNAALQLSGSEMGLEAAIDSATDAIRENGRTAIENGTALDINTAKGRDNKAALDAIASSAHRLTQAQQESGASAETMAASTARAREQFISAAMQMGLTAQAANELADKYGLIPYSVRTEIIASGLESTRRGLASLDNQMRALDGRIVRIDVRQTTRQFTLADGGMFDTTPAGIVQTFAHGGFHSSIGAQQPQIRPAGGAGILWAEDGAGPWEAFISGHPAKRRRSRWLLEETARRLGGNVQWATPYADGGIRYAPNYSPPSYASSVVQSAQPVTVQMPSVMELRDVDGALIGRMRVEARGAVHESISTGRGRR